MYRPVAFENVHAGGITDMGHVRIVKAAFQHESFDRTNMPVHWRDTVFFQPDHEGKTPAGWIGAQ
jgi:hypothetical protein